MDIQNKKKTGLQIVLTYIMIQLLTVLSNQLLPASLQPAGGIWSNILLFSLGAGLIIYLDRKNRFDLLFEKTFSIQKSEVMIWGVVGFVIAVVSQYIATLIEVSFLGTPITSQNTQGILEIIKRYPYFIVIVSIAGPIMEEFVFRKVLFGLSIGKIGGIGAAVISSLAFAFIHFDGRMLVYSVMGLVFSWLYYKTKNIWTPIIAHSLMNTFAILQIFFV
ncbi:CPBP family intramembrane glutamic endopeptidase [Marinilactibacillus sp. Marseille-P9653]|uniref:CPBP family intramembrane glutamic endopeptidase n=1 Tax=Marinilactibacillus sp. Marseille-P9653 TaxID=2866583 RepID=UPI001CE49D2C|nr:type II CAAX endopeptidase family protein [Marinilactibacillus sp. Marseille-P9653]